jgi:hypothetical protein
LVERCIFEGPEFCDRSIPRQTSVQATTPRMSHLPHVSSHAGIQTKNSVVTFKDMTLVTRSMRAPRPVYIESSLERARNYCLRLLRYDKRWIPGVERAMVHKWNNTLLYRLPVELVQQIGDYLEQ